MFDVSWLPFVLFALWSLTSFVSAAARLRRFVKYQREPWLITDALKHVLMGIAFGMGSLVVAPHPIDDFEWMRVPARWIWLAALGPFMVGTWFDWIRLAEIAQVRNRHARGEDE